MRRYLLFALASAMCGMSVAATANAAEGDFTVAVPRLHEPWVAADHHLSVAGRCADENIALTVIQPPSGLGATVVVKINDTESRFGMNVPFVHDMFGEKIVLQYAIVCAGDGFELTGWGVSLADEHAPRFVLGQVFFDRHGRVTEYGFSAEAYSFIRGHLR